MSSSSYRARRQFPVGRGWRHVAVVDAGCGCRPRRATSRLLSQLPSFLRPSPAGTSKPGQHAAGSAPVGRSSSRSSSGFFPSSASTASSATFTTTHSSFSNYSSAKHHQDDDEQPTKPKPGPRRRQHQPPGGRARKKRCEKVAAAAAEGSSSGGDGGVGVAVEKESSDPRADFRESMVQMVMEMGLCGWDDLRCMLRRLLALNAPRHHAAILAAFAEVCAQLTAPPPVPTQMPAYGHYHHHHQAYAAYDHYHYHY